MKTWVCTLPLTYYFLQNTSEYSSYTSQASWYHVAKSNSTSKSKSKSRVESLRGPYKNSKV